MTRAQLQFAQLALFLSLLREAACEPAAAPTLNFCGTARTRSMCKQESLHIGEEPNARYSEECKWESSCGCIEKSCICGQYGCIHKCVEPSYPELHCDGYGFCKCLAPSSTAVADGGRGRRRWDGRGTNSYWHGRDGSCGRGHATRIRQHLEHVDGCGIRRAADHKRLGSPVDGCGIRRAADHKRLGSPDDHPSTDDYPSTDNHNAVAAWSHTDGPSRSKGAGFTSDDGGGYGNRWCSCRRGRRSRSRACCHGDDWASPGAVTIGQGRRWGRGSVGLQRRV